MVLAPGLGSTSTCWPSLAVNPSAMTRTRASIAPPGLNGTTMRMGLVGHAPCAQPADDRRGAASAAVTTPRRPIAFRDICRSLPLVATAYVVKTARTLLRVGTDS